MEQYDEKHSAIQKRNERNYNKCAKDLIPLKIGEKVIIQNPITKYWDRTGTVVSVGKRRDYSIKLPCGKLTWRNRKYLRKTTVNDENQTGQLEEEHYSPRRSERLKK